MRHKHGWDTFRPYQAGDLSRVWGTLRPADLSELSGGGLTDPSLIEEQLQRAGSKVFSWDTEQGPVAILGVTPTDNPNAGLVWAIASTQAEPRWRFAARHTEEVLQMLSEDYTVLGNYKDSRNTSQINWLRKVGFTFIAKYRFGDLDYLEFVRIMK